MNRFLILTLASVELGLVSQCQGALPVAPAPLERGGAARVKTEMVVTSVNYKNQTCEQVIFQSGTKKLQVSGWHSRQIGSFVSTLPACYGVLYLDDGRKPLATLVLACGNEWDQYRVEPGDKMTVDRKRKAVTWSRPYTLPDKTKATSSYTVSILSDGRLAIDYDFGIDEARAAAFTNRLPFAMRLALEEFEEGTCAYGFGDSVRKPVADADIEAANLKFLMTSVGDLTTSTFNVERRNPLKAWSFEFPSIAVARRFMWDENHTREKDGKLMRGICLRDSDFGALQNGNPKKRPAKGRFMVDLGMSSVPRVPASPAVGGIDFWKDDALHVPVRPTRNQLVNGSFEQGMKGWRWDDGIGWWSPAEKPREEVVSGGCCGSHALMLRSTMPQAPTLCSQAMALTAEKPHVLSFYAKHNKHEEVALELKPRSLSIAGRYYNSRAAEAFAPVRVKPGNWRRYEIPFTPDNGGIFIVVKAPGWNDGTEMMVDGIQVEQSSAATDYVEDPFLATLKTSRYPFNDLRPGDDYGLELDILARDGAKGRVRVRIENFYSETKFDQTFELAGSVRLPLAVNPVVLGLGVFVVRMDYLLSSPSFLSWTDYARFSVLRPLANKHATAQFYANHSQWFTQSSRAPDVIRKFVEWGWGSLAGEGAQYTKNGPWVPLMRARGIRNHVRSMERNVPDLLRRPEFAAYTNLYAQGNGRYRDWKEITPRHLEFIEKAAYRIAFESWSDDDVFAFAGEEEDWVRNVIGWDAHFRCAAAMTRGVKRAFAERGLPPPKIISSQGPSHYFAGRNYDAIDGFLGAAKRQGFKYDAVAIHPYSNIDTGILGPHDADKETQHLLEQMASYGYGKDTPVYFAECFNMLPWRIPLWHCDGWGDMFRRNKAPTQARGVRECTMAGSQARLYLLALKYWPQVCLAHAWNCEPFLDVDLAPLSHVLAANTLGNILPDPEYIGGAQPYGDVRGLCFRRKDKGDYLMAVWTTNHEVEYGERKSPVLDMVLPKDVRFFDFEGNERRPSAKQLVAADDGCHTLVPLTPAPLFLVSQDADALLKALKGAVADDPAMAFEAAVKPDLKDVLNLTLRNLTTMRRKGVLMVGEKKITYDLAPRGSATFPLVQGTKVPLCPQNWKGDVMPLFKKPLNVTWFRIPKCGKKPDWSKIPAFPFTAYDGKVKNEKVKVRAQYAWNSDFLFLRVEVEDPEFVPAAESGKRFSPTGLYEHDGSLEIYFDGFGDARTQGEKGYDDNDSRYDVLENHVHRLKAVNWQLAQGTSSATDEEVREKLIRSFTRTETGYVYEIAFAARYMAPVDLKAGTVFGTGVALNDFVKDGSGKWNCTTVSMSVDRNRDLNNKPYLLPLALLVD